MQIQLKIEAVKDRLRTLMGLLPCDITIVGSYNTLNTGDRILCDSVAYQLRQHGYKVQIQSKRTLRSISSGVVIVCGGDILHDANDNGWQFLQRLAQLSSKVYFLGAGVPGFYLHSKEEVSNLLNQFQAITVRDSVCYQRLLPYQHKQLFKSVDNAFLWPDVLKSTSSVISNTIALNIMMPGSSSNASDWVLKKNPDRQAISLENYLKFWNGVIRYFKEKGFKIYNVAMTHEDAVFVKKHFSEQLDKQFPFTLDYKKTASYIASAEFVFASRYHFLILALLNQKQGYCYAYADKIENLLNDLKINNFISRDDLATSIEFAKTKLHFNPATYSEHIASWSSSHWLTQNIDLFER